jgi:hypothetical protein
MVENDFRMREVEPGLWRVACTQETCVNALLAFERTHPQLEIDTAFTNYLRFSGTNERFWLITVRERRRPSC